MAQGIFTKRQQLRGLIEKSWVASSTPSQVEYLVVAGGGAGGKGQGSTYDAGGGGAGGLLVGLSGITVGSSITVTVGAGGASQASNGANSVFGSITATGGGAAVGAGSGPGTLPGQSGGSGGGASQYAGSGSTGGSGVSGQGNAGGSSSTGSGSGGGGGAGTIGLNGISGVGANGGAGVASAISGTVTTYAGGGGGSGTAMGSGGVGGGGAAGSSSGTAGTTNTGGGGGGSQNTGNGGAGGSGIVIISYPDTYNAPSALTGTYTASTSGSGSVYFNGSSLFSFANNTALQLATGDFTLETWIYPTATNTYFHFFSKWNSATGLEYQLTLNTSTGVLNNNVSGNTMTSASSAVANNTWSHIAWTRSSGTDRLFVNGIQVATTTGGTITNGTSNLCFGGRQDGSYYATGYLSNARFIKGTALYTSNFTVPTAPLTAITNTQLLVNTVSGAYVADSSSNSFTASFTGSPTWNQLSPFATGLGYKNRVYTWTSSGTVTF